MSKHNHTNLSAWSRRCLRALVCASVFGIGCAEQTDEPEEPTAEALAASEVDQALGEFACATVAPHTTKVITSVGGGQGASATSPDGSYTRPGCPNQWVVEFTGMASNKSYMVGSSSLSDIPVWNTNGTPNEFGQFICFTSRVELGVYGFKNGAWSLLSLAKYHGEFGSAPRPGTLILPCQSKPDLGYAANPAVPPGYSKVRVAAKRYLEWQGSVQMQPATASLLWLDPPR